MLRRSGKRNVTGRTSATVDYSAAKAARLAERERAEAGRRAALAELDAHRGPLDHVRLSDRARDELLDVYAGCLAQLGDLEARRADIPLTAAALLVRRTPGHDTTLHCATGRMTFADCGLAITDASTSHSSSDGEPDRRRTEGVAQ